MARHTRAVINPGNFRSEEEIASMANRCERSYISQR